MIAKCATCRKFAYKQPSEFLCKRETPRLPWARVGVDLCEYVGRSYLVAYEACSNYPEVEFLQTTLSKMVIEKLSSLFARHRIPLDVCTDGGPQFTSQEFRKFANLYDFTHVISFPRFPRSNGLAEKGV